MTNYPSLESVSPKEPDLKRIIGELDQAATDANDYLGRIHRCRQWWQNIWDGQTYDGRKHAYKEGQNVLPWDNASDSRLRIVGTLVNDHVTIVKAALRRSRWSVRSTTRPFVMGRVASIGQRVLEWHVKVQQRREFLRECTFAWKWKYAFGLSFMGIEWDLQRQKVNETINVEDLIDVGEKLGSDNPLDLGGGEESDATLIDFLQGLSPILSTDEARKIIYDLRNDGTATLPTVQTIVNKPRWTALLPCVDVIVPSETCEIQTARFTSRRELVSEWELNDRIVTDNYDPKFVEEAVKQKGEFSGWSRSQNWSRISVGSDRDMIELHHFLYRNVYDDVPCMYRVVFNYGCAQKNLVAVNKVYEYKHRQQPLVALRRSHEYRPLLTEIGIAEEAYTDELDIKTQQDALNDRADLINNPPMVLPVLRAQGIKSNWGPQAVMTALRPNEVSYPPLPPSDGTPAEVIAMVQQRLDARYSIKGNELDPLMKQFRQQEIADDTNAEFEMILEQTLQLSQQFDSDETVAMVAGMSGMPWNLTTKDIAGEYTISVTTDMAMGDIEYATKRLGLFQTALQMNTAGSANMAKLFPRVLSIADPDIEDLVEEDQGAVTEREVEAEKNAAAQILVGITPTKPMQANHKLRAQTLISETIQSPNPVIQQTIAQRKDVQLLIKDRLKFFQSQIQQYQNNPQIGRTLATQPFNPQQPGEVSSLPAQ